MDDRRAISGTPGEASRRLLADMGCGADWLRADLRKAGHAAVIPGPAPPKTIDPP